MKLDSLKKLYIEELKDLYSAEKQLLKALPKMVKAANNPDLKKGFSLHCDETEKQIERLEEIFEELDVSGNGKTCAAMKGLIEEGNDLMKEDGHPDVIDAALIAAAQRVEHYEIAAYGCTIKFAELLGEVSAVNLLHKTLDEESRTNEKLSELATSSVNEAALRASEESDDDSISNQKHRFNQKSKQGVAQMRSRS